MANSQVTSSNESTPMTSYHHHIPLAVQQGYMLFDESLKFLNCR